MNAIRRLILGIAVLGAAMALAGAFAVQSFAGGASQASAAIVDASGATIG